MSTQLQTLVLEAIQQYQLPTDFDRSIEQFYYPVVKDITRRCQAGRPLIVGIQGSQGSGKTTFAHFIKLIAESQFGKRCVSMSLDDFYRTRAERKHLSERVHPLLNTRGVPGTHDTELLAMTLSSLETLSDGDQVAIPVFDKALDNRADRNNWQTIYERPDIIVLEGWCVGVSAQEPSLLESSVNELERVEDSQGVWRRYVNSQITEYYQDIYNRLDCLAVLKAPSFDQVYQWRLKQETKLIAQLKVKGASTEKTMNPEQVKRFISYYQRLTEHALENLPEQTTWLLKLMPNQTIAELIPHP